MKNYLDRAEGDWLALRVKGLPGKTPVNYSLQRLDLGPSQRGYFGIWMNVGAEGECFWHGSKN